MDKELFKKESIGLQKKDCCKYWIKMWFDKIAKAIRNTDGGEWNYCAECGKKFKRLDY